MTFRPARTIISGLIGALLLTLQLSGAPVGAADVKGMVAGMPEAEALRQGETMYQKGLLPSGKPMMALVQGGMEMDTSMCTCSNCHLPSGLGSVEGGVVSPPTNGAKLFAPLRGQRDIPGPTMKRSMFFGPARTAYNEETLGRCLTLGVNPDGKTLSEIMPRYELNDSEKSILIYYLRHLSSEYSPGLTSDSIRFATIVTEEVSAADRDSLVLPLQSFIRDDWNMRVNSVLAQWNSIWQIAPDAPKTFRNIDLDVWVLKGSPDTWGKQLEEYYRQKPVFAILGGVTTGSWAPMHEFCEKNKIPCLLPYTDLPVVASDERYTFYVSKGGYQEGEAAANFLTKVQNLPPETPVVQVYRNDDRGKALAQGAGDMLAVRGHSVLVNRAVAPEETMGAEFWKKLSAAYPKAVLLLWLAPADLAGVGRLAETGNRPLFFSSTLLGGEYAAVPDAIRDVSYVMYPHRLAEEEAYSLNILNTWLKFRKLTVSNMKIASQAVLLKSVLSDALYNIAGEYYRDFFIDTLDMSRDQLQTSITYPVLTFGPGQRYASKGCYVTTITKGDKPKLVRQSDWVIY